ncbi:P-loop containing nucleoside triphosphate hydrolase protein [Acephala macrosclerotiorum]|nr:P-loop containing nucleoside triphosphate hydrolase protein [Acephala macrosclerotiorum]
MDQPPQLIFARPAKSKAIPIINPNSGESLPTPVAQKAARTSTVPLHPTTKDSSATCTLSTLASAKDCPIIEMKEDSANEGIGRAFNTYARPFVPEALTIINKLDGQQINTPAMKQIDFGAYISQYIGRDFLPPIPHPIEPPTYSLVDSVIHTHYELYFRYHLEAEIQSQQQENESYSLFGHDITTLSHGTDQTTCSFLVAGLRENSPYVEEDDIVQLRQLRYDYTGRLLGMEQWLSPSSQFHGGTPGFPALGGRWRSEPAPGWTGIIYNARVLAVQRKQNRLVVRVHGPMVQSASFGRQHSLSQKDHLKFNVQLPVPKERYLPMQQVLPIIQEAFRQADRSINHYQVTYGIINAAHAISSTTPLKSYGSPHMESLSETCRPWLQSMLFPIEADCEVQTILNPGSFNRPFFDEQLNWEQKKAIESICSHNYGTLPFLISGPPGTGKTKTLVEVALQLLKSVDRASHILFCAPSDPAADMIVQRISAHFKPTALLRLNRPSRIFAEVPGAVLPFCYISQDKFDLPPFKQLMSYKLVVTTCRDASLLLYSRLTNLDLYAAEYGLYTSIHPYAAQPSQIELHWTALLIDEAAQAMEPEALIPLSIVAPPLESAKLIFRPLFVMAGDEHQLGPRTSLRSSPLKTSLFARLFARPIYAGHPLARGKTSDTPPALKSHMLPITRPAFANLIRNYRSHPAILAVPSALFYADTLEPEAIDTDRLASWSEWRGRRWPVLFRNNGSEDELEKDGGGWYNAGEAQIACWYAALLVQTGLVEQSEVCIMTPFKAQVQCLRKTIREKKYGSLWDVNIGPTEAFQGLERGVVILCTTRSKQRFINSDISVDWGIIGFPNKMNVALTRAKFGLIVIGKREILLQDPNWKAFLDFCNRNGLVAGGTDCDGRLHERVHVELTRLEKVLLAKERDLNDTRVLRGSIQDDEMWTSGMQAASDMESTNGYGHSDLEEDE